MTPRETAAELRRAARMLDAIGSHRVARRIRAMSRDLRTAAPDANPWEHLAGLGYGTAQTVLEAQRACLVA